MTSANLNRYIKEYLKRQPKTLSMSQIEELVEYDAWLDAQGGLTPRALDVCPECDGNGVTGSIGLPHKCPHCDGTGKRQ